MPGLYVTLQKNNIIKRTLVRSKGEIDLGETTVGKELVWYADLDFDSYIEAVRMLEDLSEKTESDDPNHYGEVDIKTFNDLLIEAHKLVYDIEDAYPMIGSLLRFDLLDNIAKDDGTAMYIYNTKHEICKNAAEPAMFHIVLNEVLYDIVLKEPINFEEKYANILKSDFVQVHIFNGGIETQYRFRSISSYYQFLLMHYLNSNPNLAICHYCQRFFIPKTRKETKYCDRKAKNGRTCKQIAPAYMHQLQRENDVVIQTFDRTKQKMYKRFERSLDSLNESQKRLDLYEYHNWNKAATEARDKYLHGELTAEQALKIIEVKD